MDMKLIYISHPYSGDEVKNRKNATAIAAKLATLYPHIVFINPLNVMRHIPSTNLTYDDTIALCLGLLAKCDGIIMTGEWQKSNGCITEHNFAVKRNIPMWYGEDNFFDDDIMPNDCCGNHKVCEACICRTCAERLACWNCNDCVRETPNTSPVGYTSKTLWKPECSRFRKKGVLY